MIITTSPTIQNKEIIEYKGIVFGEVITGINLVKDFSAGLRDLFGGRVKGYEQELIQAREESIEEMTERAQGLGATAIIAVKFDYETLGQGGMLMVTCNGTAVVTRS